jgi:predicted aminopeptidase
MIRVSLSKKNRSTLLVATLLTLTSCDYDIPGYALRQGLKHGAILMKAQNIPDLLKQKNLDPETEQLLIISQEVLKYAKQNGFYTGKNYRTYVALDRDWITQIVTASRQDKLEPLLFDYPILGKLPYQGFYDAVDAEELAERLRGQGWDVYERKVEAFSSVGWFPDPLVSTMLKSPSRLIELLFHELTHATFYFSGDADFNEAFASWIGQAVALEFLNSPHNSFPQKIRERAIQEIQANRLFQERLAKTMEKILDEGHKRYALKQNLGDIRSQYFQWIQNTLKEDPLLAPLAQRKWNNATLLGFSTYYKMVPKIESWAKLKKLSPAQALIYVRDQGPQVKTEILTD